MVIFTSGLGNYARLAMVASVGAFLCATPNLVMAQVTAFKQSVAENAAQYEGIAKVYRSTKFEPIWTGPSQEHLERRAALLEALREAALHGLPAQKYDPDGIEDMLRDARSPRERGQAEVELSRIFVDYARDVQTGVLNPRKTVNGIKRAVALKDSDLYLTEFSQSTPRAYMRSLAPQSYDYLALMKQKLHLQDMLSRGGWGKKVAAKKLSPGDTGKNVVALRDRLIRMGYLRRSNAGGYDSDMENAVRQFQTAHGLTSDGVAGPGTIKQINVSAKSRLRSVLVAMERERWLTPDRGKRHVLVNIPDFTAKIIDDGRITFQTRSVVGAKKSDRLTPEFSDVMKFMVINPTWNVPRSIATKEYLPALQRNPGAVRHLVITDRRGRKVDRSAVDFSQYTARNFPFSMRQPPSRSNALGLVKFMFPNKYNIYLHDTPAKKLFSREVRAFSHGCIRLNDPFDFAYALLAKQEEDPKGFFQSKLRTGGERRVDLETPVPVHIVYRTAVVNERGEIGYRRDIYGRDGQIWNALSRAGVALEDYQG